MKEYRADLTAERIMPESILPASSEMEEIAAQGRRIYNNFTRVLQK